MIIHLYSNMKSVCLDCKGVLTPFYDVGAKVFANIKKQMYPDRGNGKRAAKTNQKREMKLFARDRKERLGTPSFINRKIKFE